MRETSGLALNLPGCCVTNGQRICKTNWSALIPVCVKQEQRCELDTDEKGSFFEDDETWNIIVELSERFPQYDTEQTVEDKP